MIIFSGVCSTLCLQLHGNYLHILNYNPHLTVLYFSAGTVLKSIYTKICIPSFELKKMVSELDLVSNISIKAPY